MWWWLPKKKKKKYKKKEKRKKYYYNLYYYYRKNSLIPVVPPSLHKSTNIPQANPILVSTRATEELALIKKRHIISMGSFKKTKIKGSKQIYSLLHIMKSIESTKKKKKKKKKKTKDPTTKIHNQTKKKKKESNQWQICYNPSVTTIWKTRSNAQNQNQNNQLYDHCR